MSATYQLHQVQQQLHAMRARAKSMQRPTLADPSPPPPPLPPLPAVYCMTHIDRYRYTTVTRFLCDACHLHPDHLTHLHHTLTDFTQRTVTVPPYLLSDSNLFEMYRLILPVTLHLMADPPEPPLPPPHPAFHP